MSASIGPVKPILVSFDNLQQLQDAVNTIRRYCVSADIDPDNVFLQDRYELQLCSRIIDGIRVVELHLKNKSI